MKPQLDASILLRLAEQHPGEISSLRVDGPPPKEGYIYIPYPTYLPSDRSAPGGSGLEANRILWKFLDACVAYCLKMPPNPEGNNLPLGLRFFLDSIKAQQGIADQFANPTPEQEYLLWAVANDRNGKKFFKAVTGWNTEPLVLAKYLVGIIRTLAPPENYILPSADSRGIDDDIIRRWGSALRTGCENLNRFMEWRWLAPVQNQSWKSFKCWETRQLKLRPEVDPQTPAS